MQKSQELILNELHRLELTIALEIKRICEKYQIPYFLTAGTLLGAVRHGGFIPWDDDMDIGMLREDYERFLEVCKTDLGNEFFLQTWDTDPEYPLSYAKVRLNNTTVVERFSEGNKSNHNGVFVDIFPFDNVPNGKIKRKIQGLKYFLCKRMLWVKRGMGTDMKQGTYQKKFKYYAFYALSLIFSYDKVKKYFRKNLVRYNSELTEDVVADGAYGYKKEILKREWVTNLAPINFEGEQFLSIKDAHTYLSYFYGDYMQLPPEDKRGGHNIIRVDFGPYELK